MIPKFVIPAEAGIQGKLGDSRRFWIPASAGMTVIEAGMPVVEAGMTVVEAEVTVVRPKLTD
jgi:hypothetical protein